MQGDWTCRAFLKDENDLYSERQELVKQPSLGSGIGFICTVCGCRTWSFVLPPTSCRWENPGWVLQTFVSLWYKVFKWTAEDLQIVKLRTVHEVADPSQEIICADHVFPTLSYRFLLCKPVSRQSAPLRFPSAMTPSLSLVSVLMLSATCINNGILFCHLQSKNTLKAESGEVTLSCSHSHKNVGMLLSWLSFLQCPQWGFKHPPPLPPSHFPL